MTATNTALFPTLLGAQWNLLAAPVQRMHGDVPHVRARGLADIDGSMHPIARCLRRVLRLPEPGAGQALELTIERRDNRETWTRGFASGRMCSVLSADGSRLCERLGPVTLCFELHRDREAIDWRLCGGRAFGLPAPRWLLGRVHSRSAAQDGRYAFEVDVHLPLLGRLVSYHGWLEICDAS